MATQKEDGFDSRRHLGEGWKRNTNGGILGHPDTGGGLNSRNMAFQVEVLCSVSI